MQSLLERHLPEIESISRQFGVRSLEAFGSVLQEDFDPERSDIDLLVEFQPSPGSNLFNTFFDLRRKLSEVLGRPVDLVMPSALHNPYVRAQVDARRKILYAA